MTHNKATPRPITCEGYAKEVQYLKNSEGKIIATLSIPLDGKRNDELREIYAEFWPKAVRAVNNFNSLLEACREAQEALGEIKLPSRRQVDTLINLGQAITKATA